MSKWKCASCGAINPDMNNKCHACFMDSKPHSIKVTDKTSPFKIKEDCIHLSYETRREVTPFKNHMGSSLIGFNVCRVKNNKPYPDCDNCLDYKSTAQAYTSEEHTGNNEKKRYVDLEDVLKLLYNKSPLKDQDCLFVSEDKEKVYLGDVDIWDTIIDINNLPTYSVDETTDGIVYCADCIDIIEEQKDSCANCNGKVAWLYNIAREDK